MISSPNSIVTVEAPADSPDLITLEDAKTELGISGTTEDDVLTRYITAASRAIAEYCQQALVSEGINEEFTLDRVVTPLCLSRMPIISVDAVFEDDVEIEASLYQADLSNGIVYRKDSSGKRSTWTAEKILVEYTSGFEEIPANVQRAAIQMVRSMRDGAARAAGLRSESVEGIGSFSYKDTSAGDGLISPEAKMLLDPYVLGRFCR